jgi:hypothetical protein
VNFNAVGRKCLIGWWFPENGPVSQEEEDASICD